MWWINPWDSGLGNGPKSRPTKKRPYRSVQVLSTAYQCAVGNSFDGQNSFAVPIYQGSKPPPGSYFSETVEIGNWSRKAGKCSGDKKQKQEERPWFETKEDDED